MAMRYYGIRSGRNNLAAQLVRSYNYNKKKNANKELPKDNRDMLNESYAKNPMAVIIIGVILAVLFMQMDSGLLLFSAIIMLIGKILAR